MAFRSERQRSTRALPIPPNQGPSAPFRRPIPQSDGAAESDLGYAVLNDGESALPLHRAGYASSYEASSRSRREPSPTYGEQVSSERGLSPPLRRANTYGRHPHARPLPGPPIAAKDIATYDELMDEVEAAVMGTSFVPCSESGSELDVGSGSELDLGPPTSDMSQLPLDLESYSGGFFSDYHYSDANPVHESSDLHDISYSPPDESHHNPGFHEVSKLQYPGDSTWNQLSDGVPAYSDPSEDDDGNALRYHEVPTFQYPSEGIWSQPASVDTTFTGGLSDPNTHQTMMVENVHTSPRLVPRSSSLASHSSQPHPRHVMRSKTNVDKSKQLHKTSVAASNSEMVLNPAEDLLNLPIIPVGKRRKFNPAKLSTTDYQKCSEPWALSAVVAWLKAITQGETDLKEAPLEEAMVNLFTHKVPTMNIADAEALASKILHDLYRCGGIVAEEEWIRFGSDTISGVLYQLTGAGCYSPRLHDAVLMSGRCYAHHCMRTLKKIDLALLPPARKMQDWVTFYNLSKENVERVDRKEVERQNILHEIVITEEAYIEQLDVLRFLYRNHLADSQPPILPPNRRDGFIREVFGKVDAVKHANEEFLLAQLKYRQNEQGPWISGFSDIFREWIRKAKLAYVDYAAHFPNATFQIRQEARRNILFQQFLDRARDNELSHRLGWDTYLKAPITRLQRYGLLLGTVEKHMLVESEEKSNLRIAMEEIKAVTLECDARVAEMSKHVDLSDLASRLKLRSEMKHVQLNLNHLGREVLFRGDVQRLGSAKFSWVDAHLILFDNYLVLAKIVDDRNSYDVSKLPIPMDLLLLESTNDDPVVKSAVKGFTTAALTMDGRHSRQPTITSLEASEPMLPQHSRSNSSIKLASMNIGEIPKDEKALFPFRIRHLGKSEVYLLFAPSITNRQDWCRNIMDAKMRHAESLFRQHAEPFSLGVIADTSFVCEREVGSNKPLTVRGTPLNRAIREVEKQHGSSYDRLSPVCRATINCATSFASPAGISMEAIGTDFGVYVTESDNPRGWRRVITSPRITQIAVLEDFSLFLILADKQLIAHHLRSVLPPIQNGSTATDATDSSSPRPPQRLSGARDIAFFTHGRMKDRHLIFYKKREGVSSIYKILEPIYEKSAALNGGSTFRTRLGGMVGRKGSTECFRDFDEFYVASESFSLNLFHSSLAVCTIRGVEVLNLEKKQPFSVPDLRSPEVASMAAQVRDQRPLGMFRLSENEFLVIYETVGIYVNKHGEISRSVVLEFVGKARQACLINTTYLVLLDHQGQYVEVRNAINGRLRQIISGKDIKMLDNASPGPGTVKICMQHPELDRAQLVLRLVLNASSKEDASDVDLNLITPQEFYG